MEREAVLEEMRRVAGELGSEVLTRWQFCSRTRVRPRDIERHFARWSDAVIAAGLRVSKASIDDERLFLELRATFVRCGGDRRRRRFAQSTRYSPGAYQRRFGSWRGALMAFREWLAATGQGFPFREALDAAIEYRRGAGRPRRTGLKRRSPRPRCGQNWSGRPLGFRGHVFDPVSEQGVIALFGSVFVELGFAIETVRTGYPDCEARRRVAGREEMWERISIEFEFRSSGFRRGGHDPAGCNLIVCRIHDWPECPVQVLELREAIGRLNR